MSINKKKTLFTVHTYTRKIVKVGTRPGLPDGFLISISQLKKSVENSSVTYLKLEKKFLLKNSTSNIFSNNI